MYGNHNLLELPSRNIADYIRTVMDVLFTRHEINYGLIVGEKSRTARQHLDNERVMLLKSKNKTIYESSLNLINSNSFNEIGAIRHRSKISVAEFNQNWKAVYLDIANRYCYDGLKRKPDVPNNKFYYESDESKE